MRCQSFSFANAFTLLASSICVLSMSEMARRSEVCHVVMMLAAGVRANEMKFGFGKALFTSSAKPKTAERVEPQP